jgi:hypothetical protein
MRVLGLIFAVGFAVGAAGIASATPAPAPIDPSFLNGVQTDYMQRRGGRARAARAYRGGRVAYRGRAYRGYRGGYHRRYRAAYYRPYRRYGYYRPYRRYGYYRPYRRYGYYRPAYYGVRYYRPYRRCYRWHPVYGWRYVCRRPYRRIYW